jgi:hypothetical protein
MRVYHFTKACFGLESLQRKRLKIATIQELNDPFELLCVASKDREIRANYEKLKQGLADYMGFLCFSKSWSNPVQWSHYAEQHRGLCLGFDVPPTADLKKVRYVRRRLKPNLDAMESDGPAAEAHIKDVIATKFSHWRYEQEYRLFIRLDERDEATGFYFFEFGDVLQLREVIVGANSNISRDELAPYLTAYQDVKAVKARLAFRSFRVVTQRSVNQW